MKRVVVTGMGMINAVGHDKESSFKAICEGECGIDMITIFDASTQSAQIAGEVKNFDPETVMDRTRSQKSGSFYSFRNQSGTRSDGRCRIFQKILIKSVLEFSAACWYRRTYLLLSEVLLFWKPKVLVVSLLFLSLRRIVNMLGGFVSIDHGLQGPNLSCVTACAAGTHAISEAAKTIMTGGADQMLVVAAESAITGVGVGGFASMKALSTRNDDPKHASRPFDAQRDGFVMGEGAAALVLEEYDAAVARGARIYAELDRIW